MRSLASPMGKIGIGQKGFMHLGRIDTGDLHSNFQQSLTRTAG